MLQQILAIVWAQYRVTRNHLPRTSFGTVLSWFLSTFWYGMFLFLAIAGAVALSRSPFDSLLQWVAIGSLGVSLYMQVVPLVTLSSGWSLELGKLQIYPVSNSALFGIETLLRLTSAPEMIIVLLGGVVGLASRSDVFPLAPLFLLLLVPFNLFLQLGLRDLILHAFGRNRFRELLTVLFLAVGVLPQLLLRAHVIGAVKPYLFLVAQGRFTPWHEAASLALGISFPANCLAMMCWIALAFAFARVQFQKGLLRDDTFRPGAPAHAPGKPSSSLILDKLSGLFGDPTGALVQKELRTLLRMPRFRVIFGMACVFGILIFLPMSLRASGTSFMGNNFVPVVSLYGLLLLSDALLLNIFGFDRGAAQLYFATPIPLANVFRAKNFTAILFVTVQTIAIPCLALLLRSRVSLASALSGWAASAVVTVYLLGAGNLISVMIPRPMDPTSTFKKQAGGKMQLWLLACSLGMFVLVGFAFLAEWATDRVWVLFAVLLFEFVVGLVVYRIATDSAIERASRDREIILAALSKSSSPVSAG